MRIITLLFAASLFLMSCDKLKSNAAAAQGSTDGSVNAAVAAMPKTKLAFEGDTYDFGKIKEGTIVEHTYVVKNIGDAPLFISNCRASCGCTIPTWPKDPIPSGESAKIEVKFNSSHKEGDVSKAITVTANTDPEQNFLTIKGMVEKAAEEVKK
jgi:Protein of unknown function (DUF1573)